jgi:hypothetical protein
MAVLPQPGSAPVPELNPELRFPAGLGGYNTPTIASIRRGMVFDSNGSTRVAAQLEKDLGSYSRAPVQPTEYSEGNIKKSVQPVGPAGYNQHAVGIPDSPDDMTQEEYMVSLLQNKPESRERMRLAMSMPVQNFLRRPPVSSEYPLNTHNMSNNLLATAKMKSLGVNK